MRASDSPGQQGVQGGVRLLRVPLTLWLLTVLALEEFRTFYHSSGHYLFEEGVSFCLVSYVLSVRTPGKQMKRVESLLIQKEFAVSAMCPGGAVWLSPRVCPSPKAIHWEPARPAPRGSGV